MAKSPETRLTELLSDPSLAAAQADLAQAAALARQEIGFRQRAGAAAARLRRARARGAEAKEIAELEAEALRCTARLEAASLQARAADRRRPLPDEALAQVFGLALGDAEKPPLTAAALLASGDIAASATVADNGSFHLKADGDLKDVTIQLSDADGRVLNRLEEPVTIEAGRILYLDLAVGTPKPEPGPVPTHPTMPELVGQSEGVALAILARIGVGKPEIVEKTGKGEPDIVTAQSPEVGTEISEKTKIKLTVRRTSGEATRFLPGLIGSKLDAAQARLDELGVKSEVALQADDGPAGVVLAQSPDEGTPLKDVDIVALTVSQAREGDVDSVTMPDLVGKPKDDALEILKAVGLKAKVADTKDPEAAAGVTAQKPAKGTAVRAGATVELTVNAPPAMNPALVIIPALRGQSIKAARKVLKDVGLDAEVTLATDPSAEGRVIGQSPGTGTRVEPGETVKLTVSSGPGEEGRGDLKALIRAMARDPRADEADLTEARIAAILKAGDVTGPEAARALAGMEPGDLRDRLKLRNRAAASRFRSILRKAL